MTLTLEKIIKIRILMSRKKGLQKSIPFDIIILIRKYYERSMLFAIDHTIVKVF